MSPYEQLTSVDANFLYSEVSATPHNMGNICILEGEPLFDERGWFRLADVRRAIESRLHLVPRYRKRVLTLPFDMAHPVLVDDPNFDIANHVRLIALPKPGNEEQLQEAFARAHEGMLERAKPLWELTFVEGLEDGRVGMIHKVHHALIDGVASVDVMTKLFDSSPDFEWVEPPPWNPRPLPTEADLAADEFLRQLAAQPKTTVGFPFAAGNSVSGGLPFFPVVAAPAGSGPPPGFAGTTEQEGIEDYTRGLQSLLELGPLEKTSLNAVVGPHRRYDWIPTSIEQLKPLRALAPGSTVNDVVLAIVAGGLRPLLASRGENIDRLHLRAFVPVSLRAAGDRAMDGNRVSGIVVPLPVDEPDGVRRLELVTSSTQRLKKTDQALSMHALTSVQDFIPPTLLALAGRQAVQQAGFANLVVTNVPGPPHETYLMGARLLELHPMMLLAGNMTLNVAIQSLAGRASIGLIADRDKVKDLDIFKQGIRASLTELETRIGGTGPSGG